MCIRDSLEGRGLGSELVESVLGDIRDQGWKMVPQCGFVAHYVQRHPQWEELLYNEVTVE